MRIIFALILYWALALRQLTDRYRLHLCINKPVVHSLRTCTRLYLRQVIYFGSSRIPNRFSCSQVQSLNFLRKQVKHCLILSGCFSGRTGCAKMIRYTTTHARMLIFLSKDSVVVFSYILCVQFV